MKKIMLISGMSLTIIIGLCFYYRLDSDKYVLESKSSNQKVSTNALTMMYETEENSGEYQVSSDTTWPQEGYVFNSELSSCENGSTLTWDDENKRALLQTNTSDKCYIYFDKESDIIYLADYIINNVYTGVDGDNGLYYHDGVGSYTNANQEAGDNSYRYSGANPNNYVCFGSDAASCPNDNLYRIIGVFDNQVKLIKSTSISNYSWSGSSSNNSNNWSASTLNTETLNKTYLNGLGNAWSSKIAITNWKVGGNSLNNIRDVPVKTAYQNEIESPAESTTYSAKIGLMYVSDYGYATSPQNWDMDLYDYNDITSNNNWLVTGAYGEWSITRNSGESGSAFMIYNEGNVVLNFVISPAVVRPSFYLEPNVVLNGGSGSSVDPYHLSIATDNIAYQ